MPKVVTLFSTAALFNIHAIFYTSRYITYIVSLARNSDIVYRAFVAHPLKWAHNKQAGIMDRVHWTSYTLYNGIITDSCLGSGRCICG